MLSSNMRALLAGTSGTALQWYDFALFGYFAPIIARTYFPANNYLVSLMSVFGVFAVGYLLAPLGAVFFGYLGDRFGRKLALSLSIVTMALPTTLLSLVPGYDCIGYTAPLLILLLRMIQGFVASAEITGSTIFLIEHAKPNKKAFYGCLSSSSYSIGLILAGLSASFFTASFMPEWGWRIAFALAMIAGFLIFCLRKYVEETPEYLCVTQQEKPRLPLLTAINEAPFAIVGVIGIAWLVGIMTFGTYVFMATYLHFWFDLPLSTVILIITMSLSVDAILEPFFAMLADRIGYLKVIKVGIVLMMIFSIPIFQILSSGNVAMVTMGLVLMSVLIAITYAPLNAYMVSLFSKRYRYSGFGFAFHIGISLFGGTTPFVMMWLANKTNNFVSPAWYYVFGTIIGFVSLTICEYGQKRISERLMVLNPICKT